MAYETSAGAPSTTALFSPPHAIAIDPPALATATPSGTDAVVRVPASSLDAIEPPALEKK